MKETTMDIPNPYEGDETGDTAQTTPDSCKANGHSAPRDGREALRSDPAAHLHLTFNAPGPRELLESKAAPGGGLLSHEEEKGEVYPVLDVTRSNRRWLLLLLGVYVKYMQEQAPPLPSQQEVIEDLQAMIQLMEPEERHENFSDSDLLLTFSQLLALRDAATGCQWIVRSWLPDCEERRNLLLPLETLLQDINRVLEEVTAAHLIPEDERLLLMN